MRSMDSILSDEPSVHTLPDGPESDSSSAEPVAKPETEKAKGATPEAEKVKAKPADRAEADDADEQEQDPEDLAGFKKALAAARGDKRKARKQWQEAEHKLAKLEGELTALRSMSTRQPEQAKQVEAPKPPDFYGNPEEHLGFREKALRDEMSGLDFRLRANMSEALFSEQHEDYEDAKRAFVEAASNAPWLWQQVGADPLPARVVYREGKKLLNGGVSDEVAKLKAEIETLRASQAQAVETPQPSARPTIPKSIASARGNGVSVKQSWSGPRSLDDILG